MKKTLIILGAIAAVLLMVSTATAVPTTQSSTTMDYIEKPKINFDIQQISQNNIKTLGFLEWLLKFLLKLIDIVDYIEPIVQAIYDLFYPALSILLQIVNLLNNIVSSLITILEIFPQVVEWFRNLFNPSQNL